MNNILSNFDRTTCGLTMKVLSTVSTGLYAGSAFYVSFVDNPARMTHDPVSAITMWKPSFVRAKRMQGKLVVLSALSSFGVYGCLLGETEDQYLWLGAGVLMASLIPTTLIFMSPLHSQLIETEKCISVKGDEWIIDHLNQWNKLHNIRTFIGLSAFATMVYVLSKHR
ncbi:uncharacterized protein LOC130644512 [Hydractinia symbiolongicarpus]|uniref:uncharacterized protein LOC130644512 n=1 Tax=Hydractinia symbiolongicarpus TaxID=13093 RepID=UPI00254AF06E|nr:uncharacterized protein LOC130644512 [Hydractinia symbiolongicarpus]